MWSALDDNKIDLIVLDVMLPGGADGFTLCRRMREAGIEYRRGSAGGGKPKKNDDDVVDADFEEVDKNKK